MGLQSVIPAIAVWTQALPGLIRWPGRLKTRTHIISPPSKTPRPLPIPARYPPARLLSPNLAPSAARAGPESAKSRISRMPTPVSAGLGQVQVEIDSQVGRSRRIFFATSLATPFIQVWPRASALAISASAEPMAR